MNDFLKLQRLSNRATDRDVTVNDSWSAVRSEYLCPDCDCIKSKVDFEMWNNPKVKNQRCKECRANKPAAIPDYYIKHIIRNSTNLPAEVPIPGWILTIKRAMLQLQRLAKERELYEKNKGNS